MDFGQGGQFSPIKIELPDGEQILLTGRIDRIDSKDFEEGKYIRIIDYKSGNKSLKLSDVYNGLQLQLLTYLDAVLESSQVKGEGLKPAGILYFRIDDPIIKTKGELSDEEIEKEIMKNFKMKGLLIDDPQVVREMDKTAKGQSLIIPAYIKEDGSLGSNTSAISAEEFDILRRYVRHTITKLSQDMVNGNINIRPYKKSRNTPCEYCKYEAVCQFDTAIRDNNYRFVTSTCIDNGDGTIDVYYHFDKEYELKNFKIKVNKGEEVPSISRIYFCSILVENEMRELFGLNITGMAVDYGGKMLLSDSAPDEPMLRQQITIVQKGEEKKNG
jgi:ATP-dependent helicase/nuclease subunit B